MPWHADQTCAEYDAHPKEVKEQEVASRNLIARTTKICPNPKCGHGIEKKGGCDHMICKCSIVPSTRGTLLTLFTKANNADISFATSAWRLGR
jgi:hypothetical protein